MACLDDDDEVGGGVTGGNGEGVRKIRRISEMTKNGLPDDLINFEYAEKEVKGIGYEYGEESTLFKLTFGVSEVEVWTLYDKGSSLLMLDHGKIMKGKCNVGEADVVRFDYDSCYCTYENDYLKQMLVRNYYQTPYGDDGNPALYVTDYNYEFTYEKDCLTKEEYREEGEGGRADVWQFSYTGNVRNDANVDLIMFLKFWLGNVYKDMSAGEDILYLRMFGYFGSQSKSLPTGIIYSSSYHGGTSEWAISYVVDEEGYPTEIKLKEKESGEECDLYLYYY